MSLLWNIDEMVAAMDARPVGNVPQGITGISIDTRSVKPGEAFFAIKGDRFDGHDFVNQAMKAGAGVAVVAEEKLVMFGALRLPLLVVSDVLGGLEKLGRAARARTSARIIAVTGSVGKTTTKEMLRIVLSQAGKVHASAASFNNHWGVPLTLATMPAGTKFGVFEIGMNHAGEITPLVKMVRPHVALITTIAPAHLGSFASVEEIAMAKAEIFAGVEAGGTALINCDIKQFGLLKLLAGQAGITQIKTFGSKRGADFRLVWAQIGAGGSSVRAMTGGRKIEYFLPLAGRHQIINSLGVLGAVMLAGADVAAAASCMSQLVAENGRGRRHILALAKGDALLIDESYNANPASMQAALKVLGSIEPKGRRIAVLGDMLELGETSARLHRGLRKPVVDAKPDLVFLVGGDMKVLAADLPAGVLAGHFSDATKLAEHLPNVLRKGDVVMLKASKGMKFASVVETLLGAFVANSATAR